MINDSLCILFSFVVLLVVNISTSLKFYGATLVCYFLQFAKDISEEVTKHAEAVRRIKKAVVESFEQSEKQPRPGCCPLEPLNFTVDPRFPGKVPTEADCLDIVALIYTKYDLIH